ncbi:MAG: CHASE3 domain-containing protein [Bacteroidota bacterium]
MKRTLAFAITAQAISVVILLFLAFKFFGQLNTMSAFTESVEHTYQVINQISTVQSYIKDAETSSRGFLLTDKKEFLRLLDRSKVEVFPAIDSLRNLVNNDTAQLSILRSVERSVYRKIWLQIENTRLKKRMLPDSLLARLIAGRLIMEHIEASMDKMRNNELLLLKERRKLKREYELLLPGNVRISFIITGLLTLVFGLWIYIELKKRFRFQALLQHKLMELRQNNEELEQIAFAASHDLQEPLRKIRIFSDRLLLKTKSSHNEENYQMTERINVAATRLQNLIADLVTFNNLVQNKFEINSISLRDLICQCIDMAKQKLPGMEVSINEDELPVIVGSEEQVLILFQQLLNNAIEFRSPHRNLKISIETSKVKWSQIKGLPGEMTEGNFYYIKLVDNGIGFDEAYKSKMFKPFQRLHNYETELNARRKGMGLAMCKRVMLNVGGWIDATGQVGEGAIIHLYFPIL